MSDDRWQTDEPENDANEDFAPDTSAPLAPLTSPPSGEARRVLDGHRAPDRPRYGRTTLPDTRKVTGEEVDAFIAEYCKQFGIDPNKGKPRGAPPR